MPFALFGITDDVLNLVVNLLILSLAILFGIRALGRWGARHDR